MMSILQDQSNEMIRNSLISLLGSSLCPGCRLTNGTITDESLRCEEGVDQAVFRARLIGSNKYSASGLVNLLQMWIEGGGATLGVNTISYPIDSSCPTPLDSPADPDCPSTVVMTTTTVSSSATTTPPPSIDSLGSRGTISRGEIAGLAIGVLIATLLVVFIALVVVLILRSFKGTIG